ISIDSGQVDDQVLIKADGFPTYHLANVVDDHLMQITHVVRAEEWLSSLPKHVELYRAFGWEQPVFCHLPLIRNADRSKISKRKNPVSLNYYRRAGFLPEAMLNFLALMGWIMPDGREEFSLAEFIEHFTLERITLGGPIFDLDKLKWLNGRYLRRMSADEWLGRLRQTVLADDYLRQVIPLALARVDKLEDFVDYAGFFFTGDIAYDDEARARLVPKKRTPADAAQALAKALNDYLDATLTWDATTLEAVLRQACEAMEWKTSELLMSVRVAVTGKTATPPLFETMAVLGRDLCRRRLRNAVEALRRMPAPSPIEGQP
ncbi:MAG: glutamate--tRNA ligase, partial [Vicinamibacteria bacterium]|nr:glutamate--tRNA ligase [Vicinamibacteria bacterium]